ncbi:MAG: sulfatase [Cyclobacteriaceae bacterium]
MRALLILSIFIFHGQAHAKKEKPNFIIFIADDVSWDDLGCYGNKFVQTPNIDNLASQGLKFTNTYLTASSCSPSRNSILLSRYPHNTGGAELHTKPPAEMVSFPELLKNKGYYTLHAGKYHQGDYSERAYDVIYRDKRNLNGGEGMWIESVQSRPKDKPFFMWFAAFDAHRNWGENEFSGTHNPDEIKPPFYLSDGDDTKKDLGQYYDEIKRFDYYIGEIVKILKEQKAYANTVIMVMADNGRPFPHSKTRVNDRGMKTPFVVSWPEKVKEAQTCDALVSAIDIGPTLLDLAEMDPVKSIQGKSFSTLIDNPGADFRNYVFAEHNWHDYEAHERMVRNKDYMLIVNARPNKPQMGPADAVGSPSFTDLKKMEAKGELSAIQADVFVTPRPKEELYDLNKDKLQLMNVASVPEYGSSLNDLRKVLQQWVDETGDNTPANLTQDWYLGVPGYIKTAAHSNRGEMPGQKTNAVKNNNPGPF